MLPLKKNARWQRKRVAMGDFTMSRGHSKPWHALLCITSVIDRQNHRMRQWNCMFCTHFEEQPFHFTRYSNFPCKVKQQYKILRLNFQTVRGCINLADAIHFDQRLYESDGTGRRKTICAKHKEWQLNQMVNIHRKVFNASYAPFAFSF
jgi:hypothetical protein